MRLPTRLRCCFLLLCFAPTVLAQGMQLPDLGESAQVDFSPAMERRTGAAIMRDIRLHEPKYIDDPEINGYLNRLGMRLATQGDAGRQDYEFFALRDAMLNAFAMPGGYIGVHTGLITATRSESELASVLAHEISHVTQHHLARQISNQSQGHLPMLLALAVAILASRNNADLTQGALMAGQAAAIQNQLNYSRDFEREADRLGLQLLDGAGFDVRGMADFFERLQKYSRLYESSAPGYLRTHPLTSERIADIANRIQEHPYRQVTDSQDYLLVRSKLKAQEGTAHDAVSDFAAQLRDKKYTSEMATRFGYAHALHRHGQHAAAEQQLAILAQLGLSNPMFDSLAAELRRQQNDLPGAIVRLQNALHLYPSARALSYALVDALLAAARPADALKYTQDDLLAYPSDARLHALQARCYAALGKQLLQHRALAESYALQGQLLMAIEQLQLAQKSPDGDYFELSQVDARLRELKRRHSEEAKEKDH